MGKQPYIPLYTGDYLKDTRMLPLSVRGAWVDLMIFMWESKERGVLIATMPEYAMMMSCTLDEANFAIGLLFQKGVCDFEVLADGTTKMISRRMVRDAEIAKIRSESGSLGGRPKKGNQTQKQNKSKTKANTDIEYDNDIVIEYKEENKEKTHTLTVVNDSRETDESLYDVERWTQDVIEGNDEQFNLMVSKRRVPVNGQLETLARGHLGLCSRYGWHKKMETQQAFRNSLVDHITKELQNRKYAPTKGGSTANGPEPGKDYTERF
jgi:uncharacterized protein YdaU (DUF1376 family)